MFVQFAGDVALEATSDFAGDFSFGLAPLDVGLGCFIVSGALELHDVDCPVESPFTVPALARYLYVDVYLR